MSNYILDVEANGPIPHVYSMCSFALVKVSKDPHNPDNCFYRELKPISENTEPEAEKVHGLTLDYLKSNGHDPRDALIFCNEFIYKTNIRGSKPVIWSDNPAFDWQFLNYYFHYFLGHNPFGHSARRIGDLYCGLVSDLTANKYWKRKYRRTTHDHNSLKDAIGNAEALNQIIKLVNR